MTALAACGMLLAPAAIRMDVQAEEVIATVQGKVMEGTTAKLLYLDTSDGRMEIKIDGSTSTGNCKMLLPDKKISVSVANGNDGYRRTGKIPAWNWIPQRFPVWSER